MKVIHFIEFFSDLFHTRYSDDLKGEMHKQIEQSETTVKKCPKTQEKSVF